MKALIARIVGFFKKLFGFVTDAPAPAPVPVEAAPVEAAPAAVPAPASTDAK